MVNTINKKKAVLVAVVDSIGRILYYLHSTITLKFLKKQPKEIKKILIINSGYLGDSLLNIPMIKAIRNKYKDAEITMLINPKFLELWEDFKSIDRIMAYDIPWIRYKNKIKLSDIKEYLGFIKKIRRQKFGMAIDSRGDFRNNFLLLFASKAKRRVGFGLTGGSYLLTDNVKWKHQHEVENSLEIAKYLGCIIKEKIPKLEIKEKFSKPIKKYIVIAPGAGYPTKEWPIENWAELINNLNSKKLNKTNIILTGSNNDIKYSKITDLVGDKSKIKDFIGKLSLRKTSAVIKKANLLISPDSGSAHLAAALGTKTITLFGPTDDIRWRPYGEKNKNIIIKKEIKCSPCGLLYKCKYNKKCMGVIKVEDVLGKVKLI